MSEQHTKPSPPIRMSDLLKWAPYARKLGYVLWTVVMVLGGWAWAKWNHQSEAVQSVTTGLQLTNNKLDEVVKDVGHLSDDQKEFRRDMKEDIKTLTRAMLNGGGSHSASINPNEVTIQARVNE